MQVSVLLPTYNEAGNIVDLCHAIHAVLVAYEHEVIVVDDNSPDGTWELVGREITQGNSWLRVERRMADRGLTKSIQCGIGLAQGDIICWMDCDFSMPPALLPQLIASVEQGYDIAVGSRFMPGGKQKEYAEGESAILIVLSTVLNWVLRFFFVPNFYDFTSGFIAIRCGLLQNVRLRGDYGEYFVDLITRCHRSGARITEIPYVCIARRSGETKTAPSLRALWRRGLKYLATAVRLLFFRS